MRMTAANLPPCPLPAPITAMALIDFMTTVWDTGPNNPTYTTYHHARTTARACGAYRTGGTTRDRLSCDIYRLPCGESVVISTTSAMIQAK